MQPRTNPASSSRIAERRQARRSPTVLRIVGRPRPRNVAWLATWVAVLVAGYQFGVHFALDAVREAMSASDAAGAELPQNIFRWDQPELAPIHEKRLEELHRATSIEPVLQFWLPALLAIGLGSAVAMTAVIAPLAPRAGAGRVRLRAARLRYLQVGLLAVLASALFASAASEFLARWRPRDFPPEWSTWLASLTAPASLWIRAGLPLFLGSALVGIGFRLFRRARRHEETRGDTLPSPSADHRSPGDWRRTGDRTGRATSFPAHRCAHLATALAGADAHLRDTRAGPRGRASRTPWPRTRRPV
jgi:uncharacterized membrane protein YedE/YeeE